MERRILITGAVLGVTAIILGAFGAHALKKVLNPDQLTSFETGVRYQMYHALFLLFLSNMTWITLKEKSVVFYLAIIGVLLFSGSIYLLSTSLLTGLKSKILGPITPVGGLFLIASWLYFLYALIIKNTN